MIIKKLYIKNKATSLHTQMTSYNNKTRKVIMIQLSGENTLKAMSYNWHLIEIL